MIPTRGKVWLGTKYAGEFLPEARFTNDPKITRPWPQRRSKFPGVGGSVTHQDFGRFAKDKTLVLASGEANWINYAFKAYLDGLVAVRGASYDYKDYTGLEAVVVIVDFDPTPTFIRDGLGVLYGFTMELSVVEITVMDFAEYTGA